MWHQQLTFAAALFSVLTMSTGDFRVFHTQAISPWITYLSQNSNGRDCSTDGLHRAFPTIYSSSNHVQQNIGPARNFTVTAVEREALELGASKDVYYPGAVLSFFPPDTGFARVTGYEIILVRNNRIFCCVLDFTNVNWQQENEVSLELFPLTGLSHFQVKMSSLPKYHEDQTSNVHHLATSEFGKYKPAHVPLEPSANWFTAVSYYVTTKEDENSTRYSVEIVFGPPPVEYNFNQFEIALIPTSQDTGIRKATTEEFFLIFEDVHEGTFKIMIRPIDVYFSQPGRCLCLQADGACSNCVTTAVESIFVPGPPT